MNAARYYRPSTLAIPSFLTRIWNIGSMAYSPTGGRDLRLDLLRGFCVFAMVVDHIGGQSWFSTVTGDNHFFVSAAEGFVFISGLVLGMVSLKRVRRGGIAGAARSVLQRAVKLYVLTIALTLTYSVYVGALGLSWGWNIQSPDFPQLVLSTLTLHRTFPMIDVLALYTQLMLITPIALLLLSRRGTPFLLLLASSTLYVAYQLHPDQISFPWLMEGGTGFPFPAWQLLFFAGLALGYHWSSVTYRLRRLPRVPSLAALGALYAALVSFARSGGSWLTPLFQTQVASFMTRAFDKTTLAPGRLVAFAVVFPFAYLLLTSFWRPLRAALGSFLLPLGQNALFSYSLQVGVLGVFASGQMEQLGRNPDVVSVNTLFQVAALAVIWLLVRGWHQIETASRWVPGLLLRRAQGLASWATTFSSLV